jgi:hypothetical protein
MTKESRKLIAVKLTRAQWDLVIEATREWGFLCRIEAEDPIGEVLDKRKDKRGTKLVELSSEIWLQLKRGKSI